MFFPNSGRKEFIIPLYKKGDVNNPNNYRGITLSDISSKMYSTIMNHRLQEWSEQNNITGEFQAGFKKDYSTVDHMFTLLAMVQKQFSLNRKLYVAFIDFEKAFDSVNRSILWSILVKNGIKGKLYRCIQSMYSSVKVKVRCGVKLTECIRCTYGVKQGDVCSPVLFSLFINELATEVIKNGKHGATFTIDYFQLFILLLADDIALLSETVVGLQTQLKSLQHASMSLGLKVNLEKSNIIVFRKGGYLAAKEKWSYNNAVLPVVNAYKYLGILFSTKLSFKAACNNLSSKAKNAVLCIMRRLQHLNNNNLGLLLKLFDCQVQPIIQYGSEIWGLQSAALDAEKVHLFTLKRFLRLEMRTPNDFVYGDTGRYPLYINSAVNCIRYWLKLLRMESNRLPHKAYAMLFNLDLKNKKNWVSDVRCKLYQCGFGFVWLNQGVESVKPFLCELRYRLVACRWQEWNFHIQNSDTFSMYRTFCTVPGIKNYLNISLDGHLRSVIVRFRFGISNITKHYYRFRIHSDADLICPLCKNSSEDEVHFVLCCPVLVDLRDRYIPYKYHRYPTLFKLSLLLASENENVIRNLSIYLHKALILRSVLTS